jgi:catechol 2,3-dioxygenase-like lactoylglutathione lyase family enzyme
MLQGLNHITITVSDLVNSIGFYTDTLNMQLKAQWQSGAYLECGGVWWSVVMSCPWRGETRSRL